MYLSELYSVNSVSLLDHLIKKYNNIINKSSIKTINNLIKSRVATLPGKTWNSTI